MSDASALLDQREFGLKHLLLRAARAAKGPPGTVLVNDTRTQNNIGCRATTEGMLALLARIGRPVAHSVTLLELQAIGHRIEAAAKDGTLTVEDALAAIESDASFESTLTVLSRADWVVVNAEGSFYDRQVKGLATAALAILAKERLGRRLSIVNQSAALNDPMMAGFVARAFRGADVVALREPVSAERLPAGILAGKPLVAADVTFLHALEPRRRRRAAEPPALHPNVYLGGRFPLGTVLIGGSSALFRPDRPAFTNLAALRGLAERLMRLGHPVGFYAADKADERMLSALAVDLGVPMASAATPLADVLDLMAAASCFISGRFHASILGACTGTPPVLGEANFFKTEALHGMLKLPWPMFSYHRLHEQGDALVATVERIAAEGAGLRAAIRRAAARWARTADRWTPALAAPVAGAGRTR
jgi:hypothetical protein